MKSYRSGFTLVSLCCVACTAARPAVRPVPEPIDLTRVELTTPPELKADPAATLAAIERLYPTGSFASMDERDLRFERAVKVLDDLETADADALLVRWFLELRRIRRAAPPTADRLDYDHLVLEHLRGAFAAAVADILWEELDTLDLDGRVAAIRYLASVARGRPQVRDELKRRYETAASPLFHDAVLGRVLSALESPEDGR